MSSRRVSLIAAAFACCPLHLAAQPDSLLLRISHAPACDTVLAVTLLQQLPSHTVQVTAHDGEQATYTGALLTDVIAAGCPSVPASAKRARVAMVVRIDAWDGYQAAVALMEGDSTFRAHPVLLTWARDGAPLDAHNGPLQLIVPDDKRHARNVRKVKRLSVVAP